MKIKQIIKIKSIVKLPIISECAVGFKLTNSKPIYDNNFANSANSQTSKMYCFTYYKPLYISN